MPLSGGTTSWPTRSAAATSEVDLLNEQIQRELLTFMIEDTSTITRAIKITAIAKCLERVADHATNVAEMVIFMVKGKDIRHMECEAQ